MRIQSILVFLGLLALALLAVLNLDALTTPTGLSLGWQQFSQASLALAVLGVAVAGLLLALVGGALDQRRSDEALQAAERELRAQRALADKAEGSRMAELQRHIDLQAQATQHRERELLAQFEQRLNQVQQTLLRQLDEVGHSLGAYIGEVEDRLERRKLLRPLTAERASQERH
jgi:hypothetical protein